MTGMGRWTKAENEIVVRGIYDELSAGQISAMLPGRSRNAVIGYIDRQGLQLVRSPGRSRKARNPKKMTARKPTGQTGKVLPMPVLLQKPATQPKQVVIPEDEYNRDAMRLSVMELQAHHCRWPVNEPGCGEQYEFCGKGTLEGRSYCPHHMARSYRVYGRLEAAE